MVVIGFGQPALSDLLENADEADDQVLKGVRVGGNEIKKGAESSTHDSWIVVAESLAEVGKEMGNRGGGLVVEAVESHDGLLPDSLLGVGEEVDDLGQNGRDGLVVDELADGIEGGADDKVIVGAKVLLDGVDDEDNEVVIVGEEESDGEIAGALEEEIVVVGHLDGVDVGKGGVVAKHLDVDEADEVLLHLALGDIRLAETAFEGFHLLKNDAVLLGLGSGLPNGLHQVQKLLRLPEPALRSHRQFTPYRLQLLHSQFPIPNS